MGALDTIIAKDHKIAVLTGAGVSVPSGIPPFRGPNGLYRKANVERFLSIDYFHYDPEAFWAFYRSLFDADRLLHAEPSGVHRWLGQLEKEKKVTVITQNIDGLHTKGGSSRVIELHGAFERTVCPYCGSVYATQSVWKDKLPRCSNSDSGGVCHNVLKPDIVLFGEAVRGLSEAESVVQDADRLIVLGTSLSVTPANMLPALAKAGGVPTILVNDKPAVHMESIDLFIPADFESFSG